MIADLYDFDGTVYRGESGSEFYLFCLKKKPSIIRFLPKQLAPLIKYELFHSCSFDEIKEAIYCFLPYVDAEKLAEQFWEKNSYKINDWFRPKESDVATVVCSASPVFQIEPICRKLGVDLIVATDIDRKTGKLNGKNCKSTEKVERLKKEASDYTFRDVYTDNVKNDAPILGLATGNKYKVTKGKAEIY